MELVISNLEKKFILGDRTVTAVNNVNLNVSDGDFISIIGRSGSGKSTLLNMISGLLAPTGGEIILDGKDISKISDEELSYLRNSEIGYIMQGKSLLQQLTVIENILLPFYLYKREGDPLNRARKLLEQIGIAHLENAYPSKLSGGELRRVAIARALINSPKILLADEPTSDLDRRNTLEIMKLFQEISGNGTSIIMVTHELDTIGFGNRVLQMDEGLLKEKIDAAIA
jgi:putative ABC transport system ATP-binding protein